jgi:hypothetical protein
MPSHYFVAALAALTLSAGGASVAAATPEQPKVSLRASGGVATAQYTLHDVGAPPPSAYPSSEPIGFNDTGQIFGIATSVAKEDRVGFSSDFDCLVWTGTRFVDLSPAGTFESCAPFAIDGADLASKAFTVVGRFHDIYHDFAPDYSSVGDSAQVAFAANVSSATGTFAFSPYYAYDPSGFFGINSGGVKVGYAQDVAAFTQAQLAVGAASDTFAFVRPACADAASSALCPISIQSLKPFSNGQPTGYCAFGGCTIDDDGNVLGVDAQAGSYLIARIGEPSSARDLALSSSVHAVAMNQPGTILYGYTVTSGTGIVGAALFDIASATSTALPPVSGTSCAYYYPISMNHTGEVLGFTGSCKAAHFYWTWDAIHGTREVTAAVPIGGTSFEAFGVNDAGAILVSFAIDGTTHWGMLQPSASGTVRQLNHPGSFHVR